MTPDVADAMIHDVATEVRLIERMTPGGDLFGDDTIRSGVEDLAKAFPDVDPEVLGRVAMMIHKDLRRVQVIYDGDANKAVGWLAVVGYALTQRDTGNRR